ncbi:MAG: hypothetical protein KDA80_23910 [Planctomycetaceae bacterium]|nr:hypothetical protein [Planctomycetaceae bacterium]
MLSAPPEAGRWDAHQTSTEAPRNNVFNGKPLLVQELFTVIRPGHYVKLSQ